jgi:hypothetical protein
MMIKALRKMKTRKGSALLIVLGFLTFMIISAVSFAIYMRIEHQASANYRHTVMARHLLESSLYHAMDEVDGELRISGKDGSLLSAPRGMKFPDWTPNGRTGSSRVLVSYADSGEDARVLSLESLKYIPARLVNDTRGMAVNCSADGTTGGLGARWRSLCLPVNNLSPNGINAVGEQLVEAGRYAWVCVNVSDMLDVNQCRAATSASDLSPCRVSLSHIFGDNSAEAQSFETTARASDVYYDSLSDFYCCMSNHFSVDDTFGSRYAKFIENQAGTAGQDAFSEDESMYHVLETDSIFKSQPRVDEAVNIGTNTTEQWYSGNLKGNNSSSGKITVNAKFKTAFDKALSGLNYTQTMLENELCDYLDTDHVPVSLMYPSAERVPMVCRIVGTRPILQQWRPKITSKKGDDGNIYFMGAPETLNGQAALTVETVFPFSVGDENTPAAKDYTKNFKLKVYGCLCFGQSDLSQTGASGNYVKVPLESETIDGGAAQLATGDYYPLQYRVTLKTAGTPSADFQFAHDVKVNDNVTPTADINDYCMTLLLHVQVVDLNGNVVDSAPVSLFAVASGGRETVQSGANWNWTLELGTGGNGRNALFLRSTPVNLKDITKLNAFLSGGTVQNDFAGISLHCPDPRFNYCADDWVAGNESTDGRGSWSDILGKEGRDGDYWMETSDRGFFQSPGELGFIIRPFVFSGTSSFSQKAWSGAQLPTDFNGTQDKEHMFRTVRLYQQGSYAPDLIYAYFSCEGSDATLSGPHVNPLSDISWVLASAMSEVPANYYWAGDTTGNWKQHMLYSPDTSKTSLLTKDTWDKFQTAWYDSFMNARDNNSTFKKMNQSLAYSLSDVYGLDSAMGWYTYSGSGIQAALGDGLRSSVTEAQRKMLYSWTLDNFSDRQQLFLFIVTAEKTVPNFGATDASAVKSLAGGRAVALVWRDPYPKGYKKQNPSTSGSQVTYGSETWTSIANLMQNQDNNTSPWGSYFNRSDHVRYDNGYHEMKVLFYKQLSE